MGETKTFEEYIKIAHNLDLFLSLGKSPLEILTSTSMIAVLSMLSLLVHTTPDLDIIAGSKTYFTAGFWTDSGIPVVMGGWHHCRSLKTDTDLPETVSVL